RRWRASAGWSSAGKPPASSPLSEAWSRSSQYSSGKRVQSFAIASRMRCCCSERPESILSPLPRQSRGAERDEDERPPGADDVLQLGEPEIPEVVGEEEESHHDQH